MDIHAMQSMDWLFKKERIYLLAQFWQQRATLAEKEVNALKEQLATAQNKSSTCDQVNNKMADCEQQTLELISRNNIEGELASKDKEISQLVQDIQRLQSSISKLQENSASQIARLEEQLEQRRQHIAHLEARLDAQRDYEDVKRELSLLRSIEVPSNDSGEPKTLEMLLVERSKAIQLEQQQQQPQAPSTPTQQPQQPQQPPPPPPPPRPQTPEIQSEGSPIKTEPVSENDRLESPNGQHQEDAEPVTDSEKNEGDDDGNHSSPRSHHSTQPVSPNVQNQLNSSTPTLQSPSLRTPTPHDSYLNGKLPDDCHNNNHLTQLINNQNMLTNGLNLNSLNNNIINLNHHNFIRNSEICMDMKSPFRFDEHRYRFGDENVMVGRLGESLIPKGDPMEARLQEMLRYNMDKYSTQNLDTLHIARRVRELLSIHNIGQRLFAKYVLGLSQGTVSELLSKPKPWDKLTEKGRDSYRKMHAWACDENAVLLLKSLIPKKAGKEGSLPPFGREIDGQNLTEERIAHILSEASQMMGKNSSTPSHNEDQNSNEEDSKSSMNCPSPLSAKENSLSRRLKKYENDDIPQEKVARIYQEELTKLMTGRGPGGPHPFPSLLFPHFFGGPPGTMERSQEDIRMALDAYHRELAKLNTCPSPGLPGLLALQQQALHQQTPSQQQNGGAQDLSLPKERKPETPGPPSTPGSTIERPGTAQSHKLVNGIAEASENSDKDRERDRDRERERDLLLKKEGALMDPTMAEAIRHAGSAFSLVRPKTESEWPQPSTGSTASSPLSNSILPPVLNPSEDLVTSSAASPLQRMASITNSLISQPSVQPHHPTNQRPLKAVLPPITQQQFDMFNNLNTEDIVKRVKEQLSQYSISQRLFGESVLGLSQGSVSDLLARPKPWHMLTQKGREPFIRMKMFLEDDNAVHKLVASQYKIAPEKLMRTGGYGGATINPPPLPQKLPMPPTSKHSEQLSNMAANILQAQQQHHLEQRDREQRERERKNMERERDLMRESILPPSLNIIPPPVNSMLGSPPSLGSLKVGSDLMKNLTPGSMPPQPHQLTNMRALHQHISPSVYEMAALTQDLDTQVITTKIKEALLANNIGQKIFGEAVLGLSQGSVSELLSKPKPWHMLSIKGREPFIRMQLWLSDAHNIDRLQALKNERRELNKRRRSSGHGGDNSSDTSSNDTSEFYHSASPGPGPPSAKKQRVLFSEEQKEALRLAFALDPYPNVGTIEFLATELGLSSRTITNWFHNHRMRLKQQVPHPQDPNPNVQRDPQQPFDPVQFRVLLNQRLLEVQKERLGLGSTPFPYPPYFANSNLATLISRGLIPPECENILANVAKEQFGGLDLSMSGLKREPFDDEDIGSELGSEDSNLSSASLRDVKKEEGDDLEEERTTASTGQNRSSRRKPAAPQWVNPEWQEEKKNSENEVIINGVCVMQTDDFSREKEEETIRIEPTAVLDRYDHSDESSDEQNNEREAEKTETPETEVENNKNTKETKPNSEGNNWEF